MVGSFRILVSTSFCDELLVIYHTGDVTVTDPDATKKGKKWHIPGPGEDFQISMILSADRAASLASNGVSSALPSDEKTLHGDDAETIPYAVVKLKHYPLPEGGGDPLCHLGGGSGQCQGQGNQSDQTLQSIARGQEPCDVDVQDLK